MTDCPPLCGAGSWAEWEANTKKALADVGAVRVRLPAGFRAKKMIIVIAAVRRNNFQSMVLRDEIEDQTYPEPVASQQPAVPVPVETETTDSISVEVIDSLR